MRMSRMFGRTLRQAPAEAETPNHQLLLRAGLIQQIAAGIYSYLPLGLMVLQKIERIIREEMNAAGGQEVLMPVLSPVELWEESGRRDTYIPPLLIVKDRRERELVLGPTHEEVITDLFRRNVQSYRELPQRLYQIQTKFRNEPRARGGLFRAREFPMKDLYSFDADWEGLDRSYDAMAGAYKKIFDRCGIPTVAVLADSGPIGGKDSQEFMYLADVGEDEIVVCENCGYAANTEKADHKKRELPDQQPLPLEEVATPGQKTIDDLVRFLGIAHDQTLKAVFYQVDGRPVFVAIRGDMEVNETKLRNALKASDLRLMTDDEVNAAGLVAGSASPVGLQDVTIVADDAVPSSPNLVAGANKPDTHYRNVNYGRDWTAAVLTDISLARAGDACPNCGNPLISRRGLEMGHIFKLGTRYSEKMGATFLDQDGSTKPAIMGCYGIGLGRILSAAIEANHDERGITWPQSLAPYQVHLVGLTLDRAEVREAAEQVYEGLQSAGIAVLFDDREESPGVKFNDADLLGMPLRLTVSPRTLEKDSAEVKPRAAAETSLVPLSDAVREAAKRVGP